MAADDASGGEPGSTDRAVALERFEGVVGTGRMKSTSRGQQGAQHQLIPSYQESQDDGHRRGRTSRDSSSVLASFRTETVGADFTRTTQSHPDNSCCRFRNTSRINRLRLLRPTLERAVLRATTMPSRPKGSAFRALWTTKNRPCSRPRDWNARSNAAASSRRSAEGNRRRSVPASGPAASSDRETGAPFGAAGIDDGTTRLGLHTDPEPVGALASCDRRLIGALHCLLPEKKRRIRQLQHISCQPKNASECLWITRSGLC